MNNYLVPNGSNYTVGKTNYKKGISFDREIYLKNDLTLYGFNHASRSGYRKAYEFISKEFEYHDIFNKSV